MISELAAVLEGSAVYDEMAVPVIRIQMDGDEHLILVATHPVGGLSANFERFLRCDFTRLKALTLRSRRVSKTVLTAIIDIYAAASGS